MRSQQLCSHSLHPLCDPTGKLDGRTIQFVPERRAVALVGETNSGSSVSRADFGVNLKRYVQFSL